MSQSITHNLIYGKKLTESLLCEPLTSLFLLAYNLFPSPGEPFSVEAFRRVSLVVFRSSNITRILLNMNNFILLAYRGKAGPRVTVDR